MAGRKKDGGIAELAVPTAELMRAFPEEDPFAPVIELRSEYATARPTTRLPAPRILFLRDAMDQIEEYTGADPWDVAISLHRALCSGELSTKSDRGEMIPCGLWRSVRPSDLNDRTDYWQFDGLYYRNPTLKPEAVDRWLADGAPSVTQPQADQPAAENQHR